MAEAKGILIPYHWIDEISINDEGQKDEEYSREVAWELLKALKAQNTGMEIQWPKDRYIKAIIRGYVQQEVQMQKNMNIFTNNKKGNLSDKQLEDLLYHFYLEDKKAKEIVEILNHEYGCNYKDHSFIYKNKGWLKGKEKKNQQKKSEQNFSAENEKKSVEYNF